MSETSAMGTTAKTLRTHLAALTSAPSTAKLLEALESLQVEHASLEARLVMLRKGAVKPLDEKERVRVEEETRKWRSIEGARRKIAKEVWKTVKEVGEGKEEVERLREEWAIEW